VTDLVTVPAVLVAVRVKVVVEPGVATALPEEETYPPPGPMVTALAPETLQFSVVLLPALMLVGLAVKEMMDGGEDGSEGGEEGYDGIVGGGVKEGGEGGDVGIGVGVGIGIGVGVGVGGEVGGGVPVPTATVTDLVTLPEALVAVRV
jgi:hypothetical protein